MLIVLSIITLTFYCLHHQLHHLSELFVLPGTPTGGLHLHLLRTDDRPHRTAALGYQDVDRVDAQDTHHHMLHHGILLHKFNILLFQQGTPCNSRC